MTSDGRNCLDSLLRDTDDISTMDEHERIAF